MKKMKKVVALLLVIALSISAVGVVNAGVWEDYFNTSFLDGGAFRNDTVETDVLEEQEEPEKNWNVTSEGLSNKPPGYFNVTPKAKWTDKPAGWFDVTSEGWNKKPQGYFDVNWGIKI